MFEIVLYEPEIPPNTGNIMRLCVNVGARLHLVEPLGFSLTDRRLRRAGLDYGEMQATTLHRDWRECEQMLASKRWFAFSTRGKKAHALPAYRRGDVLLFGPETRGLPAAVLDRMPPDHILRIPMVGASRSLNLANAVAVVVYEAWRQNDFAGAT
jgi:tRNA (cytidine/uridine-2'-O-)-methyltransferase